MLKLDNFQICYILFAYTLYFIMFLSLIQAWTIEDGSSFDKVQFSTSELKKLIFILISIIGGLPPFSFFSIKLFSLYTVFSSSYLISYMLFLGYNVVFMVFYYNHFLIFTKTLKLSTKQASKRTLILVVAVLLVNSLSLFLVNLMLL